MEKVALFAIVGILGIALVSVLADISLTGDAVLAGRGYGYGTKLYGPGLRRAQEQAARLAATSPDDIFVHRMQGKIASNHDKLVCGGSPDGPDPCEFDDAKQQWCCLPGGNTTAKKSASISSQSGNGRTLTELPQKGSGTGHLPIL